MATHITDCTRGVCPIHLTDAPRVLMQICFIDENISESKEFFRHPTHIDYPPVEGKDARLSKLATLKKGGYMS